MIPKKLQDLYDKMCRVNDMMIQKEDDIMPICFVMKEDGKYDVLGMRFGRGEKEEVKQALFKHISQQKVIGYILFQDSLMTKIDQNTGDSEVMDVMIRTMFTPKEKFMEAVFYKDKKITDKKRLKKNEMDSFSSSWNFWETVPYEDELDEKYEQIKKENPEKYRSVQ